VKGDALKQASILVEQALERLRMPRAQVVNQLLVQLTPDACLPIQMPKQA